MACGEELLGVVESDTGAKCIDATVQERPECGGVIVVTGYGV